MVVRFVTHYEDMYYQHKQVRLPACRAVFHALLHVADCVEWLGPMWSYSQWTMERMCGLWVLKVKQKQQADRNLSLALLRDLQLHSLQYVVDTQRMTDDSNPSQDILDELCPGNSAEDDSDIDASQPEVCASEYYTATLHSPVKGHINLVLKDARLLRSFITADNSPANLQPLDNAISAASTGIRGRAPDDIPTSVKVRLWRRLAINDYSVEQQLFKAYIRSLHFEKQDGRDATYVRIQYEGGAPGGDAVGGFARINFFFVYDDGHKSHMLANIDIISTASVNAQLVRNIAPVRGGARGRARGRGATGSARASESGRPQAALDLSQSALLFKIVPGREMVIVGIDAIVALMGIVYCGQDGYLVRRDSCFN